MATICRALQPEVVAQYVQQGCVAIGVYLTGLAIHRNLCHLSSIVAVAARCLAVCCQIAQDDMSSGVKDVQETRH